MSEQTFKAGDCVELKHGGHEVQMTIESITKDSFDRVKAFCRWYDKDKKEFKYDSFGFDALKPCSKTD